MTLGKLLNQLSKADPNVLVQYKDGKAPGEPHSYRGYYEDLAFQDQNEITVAELIAVLKGCDGKTYDGYKGGDYVMGRDSPLWRAWKGDCGVAISGVKIADPVILKCSLKELYLYAA